MIGTFMYYFRYMLVRVFCILVFCAEECCGEDKSKFSIGVIRNETDCIKNVFLIKHQS